MPLTFRGTGIVLIFWEESFLASQFLLSRMTPHPVSRNIRPSGSVRDGKAKGSKVIEVVT